MGDEFKGAARRLTDQDLPRIGAIIGVGEDVLHAVMDVEAPKSGFDAEGRPRILFEPHIFYRELGPGAKRDAAVRQGLAYQRWKAGAYGPESGQYGKLARAILIDRNAALRACSWGRGQIMGFNCRLVGFLTAESMAKAFADSEAAQVEAIVHFAASNKLDATLRAIDKKARSTPDDWRPFALGYNGKGYETNGYHVKLSDRFNWWRNIPDTPWTHEHDLAQPQPPAMTHTLPDVEPVPTVPPVKPGFLARLVAAFIKRMRG